MTNKDGSKFDWMANRFNAPYKSRSYNPAKLPFTSTRGDGKIGYSFDTIVNRRFRQKKKVKGYDGKVSVVVTSSQNRFREAGVNPYLAQSVKQLLNPVGIKVIDVSDQAKSPRLVYEVTAFPLEQNYKDAHIISKPALQRELSFQRIVFLH